jgi:hypothetical protein
MTPLFEHERPVVAYLFELAGIPVVLDSLQVKPMRDGGMGSLRIAPFDSARKFGSVASECHFYDLDGMLILATLILDQHGVPFEIDMWRVDFSYTMRWPLPSELFSGLPKNSFQPKLPSDSA